MEYPIISSVQKLVVYETQTRMYMVGSNKKETRFRVLEVDRTLPYDLHIHDNKKEYSPSEIKTFLQDIDSNSRKTTQKTTALTQTVSAYGIVGFVRFLTGYYVILIKKRRMVATIGPHTIYKIEDTCMMYVPNDAIKVGHPDEARYEKIFQNVDLTSNFYFSYSYDVTHTLQYNMKESKCGEGSSASTCHAVKNKPSKKFVWNKYLLEEFATTVHSDWLLHITHGFIGQSSISIFGKPIYLSLIARRSNQFAGTRFLKRGANCEGAVANDIETEQIVCDASITVLQYGKITSFVQRRGSVPLFWSQDISTMVPKPPISVDQTHPYGSVAGKHFSVMLHKYGAPIIILNLVKTRENKRHESLLSINLKDQCVYLNQFLPTDFNIKHISFDMARVNKRKHSNVLSKLEQIANQCLKETGLFFHSRKPIHPEFWEDQTLMDIKGMKTQHGMRQTGIVRTNCVDCLDRTNTAQFAIGKCILGYQLYILGVLGKPALQFETDCVRMLEDLYEDHGHTLALQYGGSQLVHRVKTYRKIAPWTSHSRDIMQTLSRYYSNAFSECRTDFRHAEKQQAVNLFLGIGYSVINLLEFSTDHSNTLSDAEKQQAINLFLGIFRPTESVINLWELSTDYYLHNSDAAGDVPIKKNSYTQWFNPEILKSLPLPHDEESKDKSKQLSTTKTDQFDESINTFDEYHHIDQLSIFKECYAYNVPSSTRDFMPKQATDFSPFCLRIKPAHLHVETELETSLSKQDMANTTTTTSDTSSESDTSSIQGTSEMVDGSSLSSDGECEEESPKSELRNLPNSKDVYDFEVTKTSRLTDHLYKSYVENDQLANRELDPHGSYITTAPEISPISVFKLDSIYRVELPAMSRHTRDLYTSSVNSGHTGLCHTHDNDANVYKQYVSFKYL